MMELPDKAAARSENFLTRSFRDMLNELGIGKETLHLLMEVYLRNPARLKNLFDTNKLANDRGNLKKELVNDDFTLKVWEKLMKMLRYKNLSVTFHGEWYDGKKLGDGKGLTYALEGSSVFNHEKDDDSEQGQVLTPEMAKEITDKLEAMSPKEKAEFIEGIRMNFLNEEDAHSTDLITHPGGSNTGYVPFMMSDED